MGLNRAKKLIQDTTIAELRGKGLTCREISAKLGIHFTQIARRLKDSDVQDILQETVKFYALHAEEIREKFIGLCKHRDPLVKGKNITEYHKVMGMAGPQTSIFIESFYQDNRKQIISPHVQAIINQYSSNSPIEVELIEDKGSKAE